jgi:hypothetical protein
MNRLDHRVAGRKLIDDGAGPVFRTIVDRQNLEFFPIVIAGHQSLEDVGRHGLLVVHRDQHAGPRRNESGELHQIARLLQREAAQREEIMPDGVQRQHRNREHQTNLARHDHRCHVLLPHDRFADHWTAIE